MPKLKKHFPKICRHHKGQAFVKIDGRYVWLGRYGDPLTQERCDRTIAEWLANGRSIPLRNATDDGATLTVTSVIAEYWRYAKPTYGEDTRQKIKAAIRPLKSLYGSTPATSFGPRALMAVRQSLIERGLARTTINDLIGAVKRIFKWAVANELIAPSTSQGFPLLTSAFTSLSSLSCCSS